MPEHCGRASEMLRQSSADVNMAQCSEQSTPDGYRRCCETVKMADVHALLVKMAGPELAHLEAANSV